jgi:cytochrome d ubiquinol oxidase subunit I
MGMSFAFHIVFACVGVAIPLLMVVAEWRYLRTGEDIYDTLARRWALGTQSCSRLVQCPTPCCPSSSGWLLWPSFMKWAGPIIGMPFSLQGFAFFTEAVFLGNYMYGRERISPRAHLVAPIVCDTQSNCPPCSASWPITTRML